jgi:hypothetical protein
MFRSRYAGHPVFGRVTHAGRRSHAYLFRPASVGIRLFRSGMGLPSVILHTFRESRPRRVAKLRWRAHTLCGVRRAQRIVIATDDLNAGPLRLVTAGPAWSTSGDGSNTL